MNVKEAVQAAKQYAADLFDDEQMSDLGVEEVEHDGTGFWKITLGLSRPWNTPKNAMGFVLGEVQPLKRSYKVFYVSDKSGEVSAVKIREPVAE